ncbi:hypothetical protein [Natrarchaeobius chitinivorans]|uniref:Uncharacterized protein n=1 Tax=Natrarchaeobius chitinivorans TaxID=1679083 RepID=A0A3N6N7H5_NATCH|nr:hypothetical protein [Natrarchaeobius chitinivorans]RQG94382.1 hypothetical protein EA473_11795 [Natrarchaeobius chitinivorans]
MEPIDSDRRTTLAGLGGLVLGSTVFATGTATGSDGVETLENETQSPGMDWPFVLEDMRDNSPVRSTETLVVTGDVRNRAGRAIPASTFLLISHPDEMERVVDIDHEAFPARETTTITKQFETAEVRTDSTIRRVSLLVAPIFGQRTNVPVIGTESDQ